MQGSSAKSCQVEVSNGIRSTKFGYGDSRTVTKRQKFFAGCLFGRDLGDQREVQQGEKEDQETGKEIIAYGNVAVVSVLIFLSSSPLLCHSRINRSSRPKSLC